MKKDNGVFPLREGPTRRISASAHRLGLTPSSRERLNSMHSTICKYFSSTTCRRPGTPMRLVSKKTSICSSSGDHRSWHLIPASWHCLRMVELVTGSTNVKTTKAWRSFAARTIPSTDPASQNRNVLMSAGHDRSKQCPNCPNEQRTVRSADSPVQSETMKIGFTSTLQVSSSSSSSSSVGSSTEPLERELLKRSLPEAPSIISATMVCSAFVHCFRSMDTLSSP
mmetsp:Transcript_22495/g.49677  ORF Transcript_22495/g.49677 Transcript_22495/m.49677 type:complete len:225 (-) Transcript_22495:836-1510(-)